DDNGNMQFIRIVDANGTESVTWRMPADQQDIRHPPGNTFCSVGINNADDNGNMQFIRIVDANGTESVTWRMP
ncbi:hypothetical protein PS011_22915, partial [Shigella sonnei]|nr:hypothetical protein [Shigella sonnei]